MQGYSFSWTQPYHGWYVAPKDHARALLDELLRLHEIDKMVDKGLTHPDADAILKHIANNSKR